MAGQGESRNFPTEKFSILRTEREKKFEFFFTDLDWKNRQKV